MESVISQNVPTTKIVLDQAIFVSEILLAAHFVGTMENVNQDKNVSMGHAGFCAPNLMI